MRISSARDRGQAAVELALALPFLAVLVLGIVQVVVVVRDQIAVELAARDGARAAAVAADPAAAADRAARAAVSLADLDVTTVADGVHVTVTVRTTNSTDVPLIGTLMAAVTLTGSATMLRDPP